MTVDLLDEASWGKRLALGENIIGRHHGGIGDMESLGIRLIFARSPQAKGRGERTAGTFQDRLATELRLAGAATMEEAKAGLKRFLRRFNRRFRFPPRCPEPTFRPLQEGSPLG